MGGVTGAGAVDKAAAEVGAEAVVAADGVEALGAHPTAEVEAVGALDYKGSLFPTSCNTYIACYTFPCMFCTGG